MTRDDIAQMMQDSSGAHWGTEAHFQRFAALVAAAVAPVCGECGKSAAEGWALYCVQCSEDSMVKAAVAEEREACARIADSYGGPKEPMMVGDMEAGAYNAAEAIAADIRARGEA